jgi:methyl-accepting chemotaxis protein
MGGLPVPDEVKEMHRKISEVADAVQGQSRILQKILARLESIESDATEMKELARELRTVANSVALIRDCLKFDQISA